VDVVLIGLIVVVWFALFVGLGRAAARGSHPTIATLVSFLFGSLLGLIVFGNQLSGVQAPPPEGGRSSGARHNRCPDKRDVSGPR